LRKYCTCRIFKLLQNNILTLSQTPLDEKEALITANKKLCIRYNRYSKDNKNIQSAFPTITYALGLNINAKEKKFLTTIFNKNIVSESEIKKLSKLISNILYKRDLVKSDALATKCKQEKISQDSKEF